jgi:hypothetical protein
MYLYCTLHKLSSSSSFILLFFITAILLTKLKSTCISEVLRLFYSSVNISEIQKIAVLTSHYTQLLTGLWTHMQWVEYEFQTHRWNFATRNHKTVSFSTSISLAVMINPIKIQQGNNLCYLHLSNLFFFSYNSFSHSPL